MELTINQRYASESVDKSIGIVAGAGTGKTRVIVERCKNILSNGFKVSDLLIITFTERAAQELRSRLLSTLSSELIAEIHNASISTFHGFCMRVLQAHAPLIGYSPNFGLIDESGSSHLLANAIEKTFSELLDKRDESLKLALKFYSQTDIKRQLIDLIGDRWNLGSWLQKKEEPHSSEKALFESILQIFARTLDHYTNIKYSRNVVDFHDLEILTLKLFDENYAILSDYQRQYKQILVDEFQDTNPIQAEIVSRLYTPPDNILCIVGDPKQSIYKFRGAVVRCFEQMLDFIQANGGERINLSTNFRSVPAILDVVHKAAPNIPEEEVMNPIRDNKAGLQSVEWLGYEHGKANRESEVNIEAELVAKNILRLISDEGYSANDIACLFRNHTAIPEYFKTIRRFGIPSTINAGRGLLNRREIADLILALTVINNILTDKQRDDYLLGLLRSPLFGLSADEIYKLVQMQETQNNSNKNRLHHAFFNNHEQSVKLKRWIELSAVLSLPELLSNIIIDTEYVDTLLHIDPSGKLLANIEQFESFIYSITSSTPVTLTDLIAIIEETKANKKLGEINLLTNHSRGVQLLTIHASKGNEFKVVFLVDIGSGSNKNTDSCIFIPSAGLALRDTAEILDPDRDSKRSERWKNIININYEEDVAEQERLLYVALTRAEDRLLIPLPTDIKLEKLTSWQKYLVTAFHELNITPSILADNVGTSDLNLLQSDNYPRKPRTSIKNLPKPQVLHFTVSALESFDRDPEEYYRKYHLGIPEAEMKWPKPGQMQANVRGDIVHLIMNRIDRHKNITIEQAAEQVLNINGWPKKHLRSAEMQKLINGIKKFESGKIAKSEYPFRLRLNLKTAVAIITGTIDRLQKIDEQWEVIDFKTDRVESKEEMLETAKRYELQMLLYSIAASQVEFTPLNATRLKFLHLNDEVANKVDDSTINAATLRVTKLIERILEI